MKITCLRVASVLSILVLASAAGAQQPGLGPAAEKCAQDMKTHCSNAQQGGGSSRGCLERNHQKLSAQCKQALDPYGRSGPSRSR